MQTLLALGAEIEARQETYCTPLHLAATNGQVAVIRQLVENGADVLSQNSLGQTPLNCTNCPITRNVLEPHVR